MKIYDMRTRMITGILLTLFLAFLTGSVAYASETAGGEKGVIRGNNVEVHAQTASGSVVDGEVTDTLNAGASVVIVDTRYSSKNEDRNKWYEIWYKKGAVEKTGWVRYDFVDTSGRGSLAKDQVRYTDMDDVPVYSDVNNIPGSLACRLEASHAVTVKVDGTSEGSDHYFYYYVTFTPPRNSSVTEGYIRVDHMAEKDPFQAGLETEGFPEDYARLLQGVHEIYPKWKFVPVYVGDESRKAYNWDEALAAETKNDTNQYYSQTAAASLFSKIRRIGLTLEADMLVIKGEEEDTDKLYEDLTGAGWVNAPKNMVAYYLDPRNFLSTDAVKDGTIFQFESLQREDFQNLTGVKKILEGTFMNEKTVENGKTYADVFMEAGESYNVSPYHFAARVRQEQGVDGTSALISGTYKGFEGYYNYYNIGAYGSSTTEVIERGLERAKAEGWNSRYNALIGGSKFVASQYVKSTSHTPRGRYAQDTLYFQKFNFKKNSSGTVEASHQYMQNVAAAYSEAKLLQKAHPDSLLKEEELVFKIPVYANMPAQPCPKP